MNCVKCNKLLTGCQKMYCSKRCKPQANSYPAQKKRGIDRKLKYVKQLGGACSLCGYSKNLAGLVFHHTDIKTRKMDARNLSNSTEDKLLKELKTCQLLCHNCHSELHHPDLDLGNLF